MKTAIEVVNRVVIEDMPYHLTKGNCITFQDKMIQAVREYGYEAFDLGVEAAAERIANTEFIDSYGRVSTDIRKLKRGRA